MWHRVERGRRCRRPVAGAARQRDAGASFAAIPGRARSIAAGPHPQVIDDIAGLLRGEARDFSAVALDMDGVTQFHQRVYAVARTIPAGATLSYGEIAARLGDSSVAREVGQAMGQNPFPIIVPCHRVLAAGGKVGGFSAAGGVTTKLRLLEIEGAQVGEAPTLFENLPLLARPETPLGPEAKQVRQCVRSFPLRAIG